MSKLNEIKERFSDDEFERDDVEWLIEQAEKVEQYEKTLRRIAKDVERLPYQSESSKIAQESLK